jgi:uncharacterized membrane protein
LEVADREEVWDPPAWAWPVTTILALVGLGLSIYLTIVHYSTAVTLACSSTGTINCEKVTTSPESFLLGRPVAVWGLVYFVVVLVMCLPAAWRSQSQAMKIGRVALAILGVLFVLRLIYAELFEIDAICLWCTAVHAVMLALFGAVLVATAAATNPRQTAE